ncbi:serine hydrolase domain-containing protein [Tumebacillus permanentifrigoris]|uniref:CubicO group peptidase (Beta-lactamase class C family) n=1 Tax=Tumebacillus permanentifrigoris TaxID=378543 RepID=A0A316D633_9BACL|nr:serine hydrolase domain-containing protein [Tumebacillus permanentifrigoris]PWK06584.1 CubicO group peptidase (beta-lactamase class C family) [Tumebacillus permanentifrigoris]
MEQAIQQIMTQYGVVGLAAAVVHQGHVIWSRGFGSADLERGVPVRAETMFRVASISKVLVGTAVMQQVEAGKLQLDDEISTHLGFEVRNPHHPRMPITIRHLLTHTGSLHEEQTPAAEQAYYRFLGVTRTTSEPPAIRELLVPDGAYYTSDLWAPWAVGEKFEYSNLGTGILATILERVSGERFDRYIRQHICEPLGMEATFNVHDLEDIDRISVLYNAEQEPSIDQFRGVKPEAVDLSGYRIGSNGMIFSPQGGLRASVLDLTKLLLAHQQGGGIPCAADRSADQSGRDMMAPTCTATAGGGTGTGVHGRLLKPETIVEMHEEQWRGYGVNGLYKQKGLHVHITEDLIAGERLYGHAGDAYGVLTGMYFSKEHDLGLAYCINGAHIEQGRAFNTVEEDVAQALYAHLLSKM